MAREFKHKVTALFLFMYIVQLYEDDFVNVGLSGHISPQVPSK